MKFLVLSLLGTEVVRLEFGRPAEPPVPPRLEASGGGQFEMGFQPSVTWTPTERDADGP